ncbi:MULTISPECIES: adenosine deaminase [unclassified Oceanobacter]|uniref:adenosine deaminase n=1 Tax=unclassified Oceanobacter TaxID=2620260 RepID=UPI002734CA28|nr:MULTISPECIES: adenosine deaminase [unclassified Oceanobacter]MDP2608504.1 adenosine deaminase [Oceanobacter sp. 1_MG-2023]MDP2611599.1 adenosine deaminase [Oceanobacter sp. 2_MG-2023]
MERYIISSTHLLHELLTTCFSEKITDEQVETSIFLTQYELDRNFPDHIAKAEWLSLQQSLKRQHLSLGPIAALRNIAKIFVKNEKDGPKADLGLYSTWQTLMSRISCLPVMACHQVFNPGAANQQYDFHWPLYPYHPGVEDYIRCEQLHESHQHLNGSTSAEECWLDTLASPDLSVKEFEKAFHKFSMLRQLCRQVDFSLTPKTLSMRLKIADNIREILCRVAQGMILPDWLSALEHPDQLKENSLWHKQENGTMEEYFFTTSWPSDNKYSQISEYCLLVKLFERWKYGAPKELERLLWIYLLIQNQYLTLLVQRDDFFGFDQFQKYTTTELREETEKTYLSRFKNAHGSGEHSQTFYLEGRFAPKDTSVKMQKLLFSILRGYWEYLCLYNNNDWPHTNPLSLYQVLDNLENIGVDNRVAQLALVPHFIKQQQKNNEVYPYAILFKDLKTRAAILMELLQHDPRLTRWVRGIDAAANEMHAPPEVFAPLFRVLSRAGISHITYHVGEDFPHLISGVRSIDDAIRFLPLRNGDRLGHCTAIGITPAIWKRSLPPKLAITKETRLLDLVFIWRELKNHPELLRYAHDAAMQAVQLAQEVFGLEEEISITTLDQLFNLRDLLPEAEGLLGEIDGPLQPASLWTEEHERVHECLRLTYMKRPLRLYKEWLRSTEIREQRQEYIDVDMTALPDNALIVLQQAVMAKLAQKNIAIECPPTSNTRISQYRDVSEHHIFRWMGLPGEAIDGDISMSICLGSDDPGVFAADLKSEFYHLFVVLTGKFGLSATEALRKVAEVNENGRIYRFHLN